MLLLCGAPEPEDPISPQTMEFFSKDSRVHLTNGFVNDVAAVYAVTDIGLLPSHREGFGNVGIECAAMRVPVLATRIPGCIDSVQDGLTGLLVEPRDPQALVDGLRRLLQDAALRRRLGESGRAFVEARFVDKYVSDLLANEYRRLLSANSLTHPVQPTTDSI
jgi:glycosyltransferase involved in cell wall biosynthesis